MNIVGNIWDNVSTKINKMCNIGVFVFGHFRVKMLNIVSLNLKLQLGDG